MCGLPAFLYAAFCNAPTSVTVSGVPSLVYNCSITVSANAPLMPTVGWTYDVQVTGVAAGTWRTYFEVLASPDNNAANNARTCQAVVQSGDPYCSLSAAVLRWAT